MLRAGRCSGYAGGGTTFILREGMGRLVFVVRELATCLDIATARWLALVGSLEAWWLKWLVTTRCRAWVVASLEGRTPEEVGETKAVVERDGSPLFGDRGGGGVPLLRDVDGLERKTTRSTCEGGGTALTSLREGRRHAAACLRRP